MAVTEAIARWSALAPCWPVAVAQKLFIMIRYVLILPRKLMAKAGKAIAYQEQVAMLSLL